MFTEYQTMTYEDLLSIKAFLNSHQEDISASHYRLAMDAVAQMEYWFIDGQPTAHYDPGFYRKVFGPVCWSFVTDNPDTGWYNHPEDFPAYYERMLFN